MINKRTLPAFLFLFAVFVMPLIPAHSATIMVGDLDLPQDQVEVRFQQHPLSRNPDTAQDAPAPRPFIQIGCLRYPVTLNNDGRVLSATRGTLWTDGIVYYQFDPAVSQQNRGRFVDAAAEWGRYRRLDFY